MVVGTSTTVVTGGCDLGAPAPRFAGLLDVELAFGQDHPAGQDPALFTAIQEIGLKLASGKRRSNCWSSIVSNGLGRIDAGAVFLLTYNENSTCPPNS